MRKLISTNPAKGNKVIGWVPVSSVGEVRQKVAMARRAAGHWKELGVAKRTELVRPIFQAFLKQREKLALLITKEIGKPIRESFEDIVFGKDYFDWFVENGRKYLAEEITFEDVRSVHKVIYEPLGVAAVIVPWNFPLDMFVWGVIPNLIAGNTVVFKHSERCPLTGKMIEEVMNKSGLPEGVFSEIYGDGGVGEILVNQDIDLIWFTGSSRVGRRLFQIAGRKFIKAILEMGGSNPAIIFDDIDVKLVARRIYTKRFMNCGQVCDAVKRLILHQSIFDEFLEELKKETEAKIIGDPENKKTDIGSLVSERQVNVLESQVKDAIKKGAKVITGGKRPKNLNGAYYLPTILTNVKRNMRVWKEETFGPVLAVVPFKKEEEAIRLANDTNYGLGAQIYTRDRKRAVRLAENIEAATIENNDADHWLPCNPFGGYKNSGAGREHGRYGFQELTRIKLLAMEK